MLAQRSCRSDNRFLQIKALNVKVGETFKQMRLHWLKITSRQQQEELSEIIDYRSNQMHIPPIKRKGIAIADLALLVMISTGNWMHFRQTWFSGNAVTEPLQRVIAWLLNSRHDRTQKTYLGKNDTTLIFFFIRNNTK